MSNSEPKHSSGIQRVDRNGDVWIDAMAGRISPQGYGFAPHLDAIGRVAMDIVAPHLAVDEASVAENDLPGAARLRALLDSSGLRSTARIEFCSCRDVAVESAILAARKYGMTKLGDSARYRTVALLGSDHGKTAMCRTLSGRCESQQDLGPMMAGFAHVAIGDSDALKRNIDSHTIAVVVSPIAIHDSARLNDAEFLKTVRELCDENGALLIADESDVSFGFSGMPIATAAIAQIEVDAVIFSAGLFGTLDGAVLIGNDDWLSLVEPFACFVPLLDALLDASLAEIDETGFLEMAMQEQREFVVALAERLSHFEFVQDIHANGTSVGIELDTPSSEVIQAAMNERLLIEPAGEHSIRMQLPLVTQEDVLEVLTQRLATAFEAVERATSLSNI